MTARNFIALLPPEILFMVLSYIDPDDCIACMKVCRHWRQEIPLYTRQSVWRSVYIAYDSLRRKNDSITLCLGPHVSDVHIHRFDAVPILQTLKTLNCALTIIDLAFLNRLSQTAVRNVDASDVLAAVAMFKSSLKELYLSDVPCQVFVDQLMRICPKLTHLKLQFDRWISRQVSMSTDIEAGDGDDAYSLTFLHLDNAFDFDSYLIPVLRRCPKLRVLLVPVNPNRTDGDLYVPRNFGMISRLCPLLRVILWEVEEDFYDIDQGRIEKWFHLTNTLDADEGLLELIFSGADDDLEPMLPLLTRSQNTLEYLSIHGGGHHMQWSMPETLVFPKMKELLFVLLAESEEIWVGLMQRCENIEIAKLILNASNTPVNPILQELSTKSRLQFLELIDYSKHHIDPSTEVEYDFSVLAKNTQLEELQISGMCVTNQVLLDLAGILSLRDLYVGVEYHGSCLGLKGLVGFVDKLVAVESGIQSLSFVGCGRVNDQVLKRLAKVDSLCSLDIKSNAQITDAGVLSFIEANRGRKVNVESCLNVSYGGLWNTDSI